MTEKKPVLYKLNLKTRDADCIGALSVMARNHNGTVAMTTTKPPVVVEIETEDRDLFERFMQAASQAKYGFDLEAWNESDKEE